MAAEKINNKLKLSTSTTSTSKLKPTKNLYLHYKYHPCEVSRKAIRNAYENICKTKNVQGYSFKNTVNISGGENLTIN